MDNVVQWPHLNSGGEELVLHSDRQDEILQRHSEGQGIKRIAREMDISRNTVRQVIRAGQTRKYERKKIKRRLIEPYETWIKQRFEELEGNATLLYQELKEKGYTGGYTIVRETVQPLRATLFKKATLRFETGPGVQAQVDWGSKTVSVNGQARRLHIFVMTMGYSRAQYIEFTDNEKLGTFLRCHENAFYWFNGVTEEILYDNPRTVVEPERQRLNTKFEDFTRYYGYTVKLCRPMRARTKGKVESGVKYVKRSFLPGKTFDSIDEANRLVRDWIRKMADERIHGTTFEQPSKRFMLERERLTPILKQVPYTLVEEPIIRKVANDCMVNLDTNRYSVPWQYIGKEVEIKKQFSMIRVFYQSELIASHTIKTGKHINSVKYEHYAGLVQQKHTDIKPLAETPLVEVRPLSVYELLSSVGGDING